MDESARDIPSGEDFFYLLVYAPGCTPDFNEGVRGNVWLQKEMFLLKTVVPAVGFEFNEHRYGAYSAALDDLRKRALGAGTVEQADGDTGAMRLTPKGEGIGRELWDGTDGSLLAHVSNVKKYMNDLDRDEVVAYTCSTFPGTAANSEILEQFEETRVDAACRMFSKKKATVKKAAQIAGKPLDDFVEILEGRGIHVYTATAASYRRAMKEFGYIS